MDKQIIVSVENTLTRVAVMEEGDLAELYTERDEKQRVAGNIYLGKVMNVLPGMQAAFLDIGFEKNAFLFAADAVHLKRGEEGGMPSIKDLVKQDDFLLVQVEKEAIGTKGARVITEITLPGRFLVLMPTVDYIGISRRIENETERARLKAIGEKICPEGMGLIIRTVAEGVSEEELVKEAKFLHQEWIDIQKKASMSRQPICVYQDNTLIYRIVRDLFNEDVQEMVVDNEDTYNTILEVLGYLSPELKKRVKLYKNDYPIFDFYNIEKKIRAALERKVWLKSGGYLIIDSTEALTAIDVNTGKFVGTNSLEDTVLRTNLEAVREIVHQIRLRNIGGIIIIDFIDMAENGNKERIIEALQQELKKDKTKSIIMGFTKLGLLEMTRKKTNPPISEFLTTGCSVCGGTGKVLSDGELSREAGKKLEKLLRDVKAEAALFELYPRSAAVLIGRDGENLKRLEAKYNKHIYLKGSHYLHPEEVIMSLEGTVAEVEASALPVKVGDVLEGLIEDVHATDPGSGILRLNGYIIQVLDASKLLGQRIRVRVSEVSRTYAVAKIFRNSY